MNKYLDMRNRHQAEVNAFPMHFCFGEEQIRKKFEELGLDREKDLDKIVVIKETGGFVLKEDAPALKEMLDRHSREMEEAIADDKSGNGFIYEMFLYELNNHEYGYTYDASDTLRSLKLTLKQIEASPALKHGWDRAKKKIKGE